MTITSVLQFIVTALVVAGMAWVSVRTKAIKKILVWGLIAALIPSVLLNFHKLFVSWSVELFFIYFIPMIIVFSTLTLGASITAWIISVRLGNPNWIGILCGVIFALALLVPANVIGIIVLITIIPGSWP